MRSWLSRTLAKVIFLAAVLGAGLSGTGASNAAQANAAQQPSGTVRSTHGAWSIICDTPAGATSEQCVMMQNVVAED
ncbi:MAG: invasion associated locus B family protein, partial [Mesorhizobium sp.]